MATPRKPKIYHITHLANLQGIVRSGQILSDSECTRLDVHAMVVGMSDVKRRRLLQARVDCHPGTTVGEYVPFNFCPRSVMLYILHRGNHPELNYGGGQTPIVHLQADLHDAVHWAQEASRRWAFSNCNAGAGYAEFFKSIPDLSRIDWAAVQARDFRDPRVKDAKQAEFLVHESCPWLLVEKIGVQSEQTATEVVRIVGNAPHNAVVKVEAGWYY